MSAIVHLSLPWLSVIGATIRLARDFAIIASISVTAGAIGVTASGTDRLLGASGLARASVIVAVIAAWSTSRPHTADVSS